MATHVLSARGRYYHIQIDGRPVTDGRGREQLFFSMTDPKVGDEIRMVLQDSDPDGGIMLSVVAVRPPSINPGLIWALEMLSWLLPAIWQKKPRCIG